MHLIHISNRGFGFVVLKLIRNDIAIGIFKVPSPKLVTNLLRGSINSHHTVKDLINHIGSVVREILLLHTERHFLLLYKDINNLDFEV